VPPHHAAGTSVLGSAMRIHPSGSAGSQLMSSKASEFASPALTPAHTGLKKTDSFL